VQTTRASLTAVNQVNLKWNGEIGQVCVETKNRYSNYQAGGVPVVARTSLQRPRQLSDTSNEARPPVPPAQSSTSQYRVGLMVCACQHPVLIDYVNPNSIANNDTSTTNRIRPVPTVHFSWPISSTRHTRKRHRRSCNSSTAIRRLCCSRINHSVNRQLSTRRHSRNNTSRVVCAIITTR
jgi:hypothetical protein